MKNKIKNHVRFKGNFKQDVQGEPLGRDLAELVARQLQQRNYVIQSVELEDFWFIIHMVVDLGECEIVILHSTMRENYWEISCQPTKNTVKIFGGPPDITEWQKLLDGLDEILRNETRISDIKWYEDYTDLLDDYEKRPAFKIITVIYRYLGKITLPLCIAGIVLWIIGGIGNHSASLLLKIGTVMFFLPIVTWLGLAAVHLFLGLLYRINTSFNKAGKME